MKQLRGKRVFLFGTAGFGGSAPYFEKILAATRQALDGSNTVIGSFMCQGKMPVSVQKPTYRVSAANAAVSGAPK